MIRPFAVLGLLFVLTACQSTGHWRNPQLPPERWAKDEAACKRWAAREVDREYAADLDAEADRGDTRYGRPNAQGTGLTLFESKRRRNTLTADCMRSRGYVPAKE